MYQYFRHANLGHYDYQCPSKNLYTDIVCFDDINNLRISEDVHIPSKFTVEIFDELVESNILPYDIVFTF